MPPSIVWLEPTRFSDRVFRLMTAEEAWVFHWDPSNLAVSRQPVIYKKLGKAQISNHTTRFGK